VCPNVDRPALAPFEHGVGDRERIVAAQPVGKLLRLHHVHPRYAHCTERRDHTHDNRLFVGRQGAAYHDRRFPMCYAARIDDGRDHRSEHECPTALVERSRRTDHLLTSEHRRN
jgi:hypothetical protein